MSRSRLESKVQERLSATEPIGQSKFVNSVSKEMELDQQEVLSVLKTLMQHDEVSYTLDYNLRTEGDL